MNLLGLRALQHASTFSASSPNCCCYSCGITHMCATRLLQLWLQKSQPHQVPTIQSYIRYPKIHAFPSQHLPLQSLSPVYGEREGELVRDFARKLVEHPLCFEPLFSFKAQYTPKVDLAALPAGVRLARKRPAIQTGAVARRRR